MRARSVGLVAAFVFGVVLVACQPVAPPPPPSPMTLGWNRPGVDGPIAADPAENLLWALDEGSGTLEGLDAASGNVVASHSGISLNSQEHFPTPAVTAHWVAIESDHQVRAFSTPAASSPTSWVSPVLDGIIQARPVIDESDHVVVVATENNSLYGLSLDGTNGTTPGQIVWSHLTGESSAVLGAPEPQSRLPCGDIFPLGITSNPVLDNGSVYAVGEVQATPPVHELVGVKPADGTVTLSAVSIDPPAMDTTNVPSNQQVAQQQRTGLVAVNGNVYIGFGGLAGDCGQYHGWVVEATESSGSIVGSLEIAANHGESDHAGAVWATGGLAVDGSNNVYASTGNAFSSPSPPGTDYSDAVVKLPALSGGQTVTAPADYFQPAEWRNDNNADADLASTAPVIRPSGTQLFILGKQHNAFLLNISQLGGSNHETPAARLDNVCSGEAFGQNAVLGSSAYVACSSTGMLQIKLP